MELKLYEIDKIIRDVIENGFSVNEETGEVLFTETDIESLNQAFDTKVDSIACYIKDLEALNEAIDNEIANLQARKKFNGNKADSLRCYLTNVFDVRKQAKFESARNKITFRTSKSVAIDDENLIDKNLFSIKIDKKPDKKKIREMLDSGLKVKGCHLEVAKKIQIK